MALPRKLDLQTFLGSSVTEPVALRRRRKAKSLRLALVFAVAVLAVVLMVSPPGLLFAQSSSAGQNPSGEPEGVTSGGYMIHSSVDVGGRYSSVTGSGDMYDTLVNLQSGPRFLDQTLSMQSLGHQGVLFDNLYVNSFGWGGDPNNALRLRADKDKLYNLQVSFRRDQNFSDFDLLANPLNPSTSAPTIQVQNSPHEFETTRRMSDADLTLLPQSPVSFRLGFSRNNMTGPSYSSIHEGTDALLLQTWDTTMNAYRLGVDWEAAPRTVISYDQFLNYYLGDTYYQLAPPQLTPGTSPLLPSPDVGSVQLGLPFDTVNSEPCKLATGTSSLIVNGVLTNPTCNGYFSYSRYQRIRTSTPTERVSLSSNYFQRVDLTGSYSYSSATMTTPLNESFNGLITRGNTLAFTGTGAAAAKRISDVLDLEATVHLTQRLRLIEKFYFWAYRIPENGNFNELDYSCAAPPCTLLNTPLTTPEVAGGTPTLAASSFNQAW